MRRFLKEDIQQIISNENIPWEMFNDSIVLVTGATGLVGSVIVKVLSVANSLHNLSMRIIGHGRNFTKGKQLKEEYGIDFVASDICNPNSPIVDVADRIDFIFHCAALTQSADMVAKPVEVMTTAVDGTRNVLELAKARKCRSFVYLSSMEVYGQIASEVRETDLGYLDLSNPRSSYPESKRFCENLCAAYGSEHGVPIKIARLALTFGAGAPDDPSDSRVAMQFARNAVAGADIVLHTTGSSITNCCYTADAITGLLLILLKGKNGEAYNIANPDAVATVREMAEIVAQSVGGGKISVVVNTPEDIAQRGYAPDATMRLNADKLKMLGWQPNYNLGEMYQRMTGDWIPCENT